MNAKKLVEILKKHNQPAFRLKQIQKAVFKDGISVWAEITTLSKELREKLKSENILSFTVEKVLTAKDGQSVKALLKLQDGKLIETVLLSPLPGAWSVCISCQVGCPMGCRFCATGGMGLQRNLTAEEISDQVLFWKQYIMKNFKFQISNFKSNPNDKKQNKNQKIENCKLIASPRLVRLWRKNYDVTSIVYMGMGEPFMNWSEVGESLKNLTDPELFGFGSRSISVSTAGIPEGIERMAQEFPQVNLALSLHFATDKKRDEFMPVNKKDNLENLKIALQKYFQKTRRKVFIEYVLLENINDAKKDADELANYLKSIGNPQLLHVNLIRYNTTSGNFQPSSKNKTQEFKNRLLQRGVGATVRKSLGEEIQGACGQLAGRQIEK